MMMTRPQADAIAVLVHELRPDWDARGLMAALAQCRDRQPAAVAIAAVRAAMTETNRTPAVIPLAGPHWSGTTEGTARPETPRVNELCTQHARPPSTCPWCTGKLPEETT